MQKPHVSHSALHFLRSQQNGVVYTYNNHSLQFDTNTISFKPLIPGDIDRRPIKQILKKFQATLRIYKDTSCHKLKLCFSELHGINKPALKAIGLELACHFRNLCELKLNFCRSEKVTEEGILYLINPISKALKNLRKLELSFVSCPNIDNKAASYIRRLIFQRVKNLEKLSVNFSAETSEIPGYETVPFEVNIKQRLQAQNTLMDARNYIQINDMTLERSLLFYYRLSQYLHNLQEFSVIIPPMMSERDYGKDVICSIIPRLLQLRKLHFCSYMEDSDLQEISKCIGKSWPQLQYITLELKNSGFPLKEQTLNNLLANTLVNSPQLKGFGLSLCGFKGMTYTHIYYTIKQICLHAKRLETLTLNFVPVEDLNNKIIQKFIDQVSQHLSNLEELVLNFQQSYDESQISAYIPHQPTFDSLKKLHLSLCDYDFGSLVCYKNLEALTFSFSDCRQMSNSNFEDLLLKISKLTRLQYLSLLFSQASLINDEAIAYFCSMNWSNLSTLKYLTFGISDNKKLTDMELSHLSRCICENFKELTHLEVIFRNCRLDGEVAITSFLKFIAEKLIKLENLILDFFRCGAVSETTMNNVAHEIEKHVKTLRKLTFSLMTPENAKPDFIIQIRKKLRFIPVVNLYCTSDWQLYQNY